MTQEENKLVEENLDLVWWTMNRYYPTTLASTDREDFYQIGCIGLMNAARIYDPSRDEKFSTFAVPQIRRMLSQEFQYRYRQCRSAITISMDTPVKSMSDEEVSMLNMIPDPRAFLDENYYDLDKFEATLTPPQKQVWRLMRENYTPIEIAGILRVSRQDIMQKTDRIRYYFAEFYGLKDSYKGKLDLGKRGPGRPKKIDILKKQLSEYCPSDVSISVESCEDRLTIRFDRNNRHAVYFASPDEKNDLYTSDIWRKLVAQKLMVDLEKEI